MSRLLECVLPLALLVACTGDGFPVVGGPGSGGDGGSGADGGSGGDAMGGGGSGGDGGSAGMGGAGGMEPEPAWARVYYPTTSNDAFAGFADVVVDPALGIFVTGFASYPNFNFGGGPVNSNDFTVRFDMDGLWQWHAPAAGSELLLQSSFGQIVSSGNCSQAFGFDECENNPAYGNDANSRMLTGVSMSDGSNQWFELVDEFTRMAHGDNDTGFLARRTNQIEIEKRDAVFATDWKRTYPTVNVFTGGVRIESDGAGGLVVLAALTGGGLMRLDADGDVLWQRDVDESAGIAVNSSGEILTAEAGRLRRWSPDGTALSDVSMQASADAAIFFDAALHDDGNALVMGSVVRGSLSDGTTTIEEDDDVLGGTFIMRLDASGALNEFRELPVRGTPVAIPGGGWILTGSNSEVGAFDLGGGVTVAPTRLYGLLVARLPHAP